MYKYAVDYSGWIYVEASSAEEAMQAASNILSAAMPYEFHDGDWEIVDCERVEGIE